MNYRSDIKKVSRSRSEFLKTGSVRPNLFLLHWKNEQFLNTRSNIKHFKNHKSVLRTFQVRPNWQTPSFIQGTNCRSDICHATTRTWELPGPSSWSGGWWCPPGSSQPSPACPSAGQCTCSTCRVAWSPSLRDCYALAHSWWCASTEMFTGAQVGALSSNFGR